ncbi:YqjF family protein [Kineococcus gynurae]|uniref:YqjF family protein n=1 Tax=Kineococcus gynurae TaxID=452979 RepID=A0ABV5LU24_9ACTN
MPIPFDRLPPASAVDLRGPVMMHQHWDDLAFLHWAVDPAVVAPHLPPGVEPDVLDGVTYVGLIPFTLRGAAPGRLPAVPWLGTFLETNVRLYSRDARGRRGVVFVSLDADRLAVVLGARLAFNLPYRFSAMDRHERWHEGRRELLWRCRTPAGARSRIGVRVQRRAPRGADADVARFCTARFGLHVRHLGRTWWIANEHEEWRLREAELTRFDDGLLAAGGFDGLATRAPDSVLFSVRVSTRFALPVPL